MAADVLSSSSTATPPAVPGGRCSAALRPQVPQPRARPARPRAVPAAADPGDYSLPGYAAILAGFADAVGARDAVVVG